MSDFHKKGDKKIDYLDDDLFSKNYVYGNRYIEYLNDKTNIILPYHKNIMFGGILLFIPVLLYAFYKKKYCLTIAPILVFLTSINYWRKPKMGSLNRYIDIFIVFCSFLLQSYFALHSNYRNYYFMLIFLAIILHLINIYLHKYSISKKNKKLSLKERLFYLDISVYIHSLIHIVAYISLIVLCNSKISIKY